MLIKLLRIYKPDEIHERKRKDNPGPGIVIFERTSTTRCYNCKWNEYELYCSRYQLTFMKTRKIENINLAHLCMKICIGTGVKKQTYTLKSIKKL